MTEFLDSFRDVSVVNLTQNYRSHADVLHIAHAVAEQIESRLHHGLEGVSKTIEAAGKELPLSLQSNGTNLLVRPTNMVGLPSACQAGAGRRLAERHISHRAEAHFVGDAGAIPQ